MLASCCLAAGAIPGATFGSSAASTRFMSLVACSMAAATDMAWAVNCSAAAATAWALSDACRAPLDIWSELAARSPLASATRPAPLLMASTVELIFSRVLFSALAIWPTSSRDATLRCCAESRSAALSRTLTTRRKGRATLLEVDRANIKPSATAPALVFRASMAARLAWDRLCSWTPPSRVPKACRIVHWTAV